MRDYGNVLEIVKASLWGGIPAETVTEDDYAELRQHALAALPAGILNSMRMDEELRGKWQKEIYQVISANVNYRRFQAALPVTVPYMILKGTSAAMNYPHPLYRTMGDIDILPRREDYAAACGELIENGFREITDDIETARGRHRQFEKNGILVEVHAQYVHQNDPEKAKMMDDLIIGGIRENHVPPDDINGLVLIDHINHHMENGLGLRLIIDWMTYVNRCLPDEKWPAFRELVRSAGLEKLAVITARMCEIYLGLPSREWCAGADPAVCDRLMRYVMDNGNFGRKQGEDSRTSQRFLSSARTLKGTYRFLRGRALLNWPAVRKYPVLRPFAWLHQAFRYLKNGLLRKDTLAKLRAEYEEARQRNELFDDLDIKREEEGLARFQDGKYVDK